MKVIVLQKERMIFDLVARFLNEKYLGAIVGTIDPEEALKSLRQEQKQERDAVLITCHYPKTMRDALAIARLVKRTLPGVPVYTYSAIQVCGTEDLALIDGQIKKPCGARNSAGHFATVAQVFSRLADGASADEIKNEFPGMVI